MNIIVKLQNMKNKDHIIKAPRNKRKKTDYSQKKKLDG